MSTEFQHKYGHQWPAENTDLDIEFAMIRGKLYGAEGPLPHYEKAQELLWPEDDVHRWSELALETLVQNTVTVLMGPSDSGKTYPTAKWGLMEYWSDPEHTLVLVSSTDVRGLELRIWGAMKDLFNRAKKIHPYLEGTSIDHKYCITTDRLSNRTNEEARVLRKGIICIPCMQSGRYVGLGKYVGVKQKRLRQIADECQLMGSSFLDAVPNFLGKDYQGAFLGNPLEQTDPLGKIAEPLVGWGSLPEPKKTTTWRTRMFGGKCVNFVGTDSPNFDYPQDRPPRYPYMISWLKINTVKGFWGEDSIQFYSQCIGVMRSGLVGKRIITVELCRQHHAHDRAVWKNMEITKIYGLDPNYGGEDRCVGGPIEFGEDLNGVQIIRVIMPKIYSVQPGQPEKPEDQIARQFKQHLDEYGIPPNNSFYDPYGKGTIGYAFSKVFKEDNPIPIDSGAPATSRPVRYDLFVWDEDTQERRLKRCDEHYSKFVTEAWFSARYVVESEQMRELPEAVRDDGCLREYGVVAGNKFQVESKEDTRDRMGRSPDLFDWLTICVEGARQRGFKIKSEKPVLLEFNHGLDPVGKKAEEFNRALKDALLNHA